MDLRVVIILLTLAGAVLPILGAVRAARHAKRALDDHVGVLDEFDRLLDLEHAELEAVGARTLENSDAREAISERYREQRDALGITPMSWENMDTVGERAVTKALQLAAGGNGWNITIIVLGIAASTVASVWSLYLPPA